ncbi:MAG: AAA family ATPase [Oligoflexia bacterium]|nr:AAA family ATPase [Oligoflexia bacterium]
MMKIKREIASLMKEDNHILFGPRQTGKSTLLKDVIKPSILISMEDQAHKIAFANDDFYPIRLLEKSIGEKIDTLKKKIKGFGYWD